MAWGGKHATPVGLLFSKQHSVHHRVGSPQCRDRLLEPELKWTDLSTTGTRVCVRERDGIRWKKKKNQQNLFCITTDLNPPTAIPHFHH